MVIPSFEVVLHVYLVSELSSSGKVSPVIPFSAYHLQSFSCIRLLVYTYYLFVEAILEDVTCKTEVVSGDEIETPTGECVPDYRQVVYVYWRMSSKQTSANLILCLVQITC